MAHPLVGEWSHEYIVIVFFVFIYLAESSCPARPEVSFPVGFLPKHSNELGDAGSTCHSALVWVTHTWLET